MMRVFGRKCGGSVCAGACRRTILPQLDDMLLAEEARIADDLIENETTTTTKDMSDDSGRAGRA